MKSAIISGAILICLIVLISVNSFMCIDIIEELEAFLGTDPALTESGADAISGYWSKHETFLHLGVNSRYIDSVSESIAELKAAIKTKSEEEITSSLDVLSLRLDQLKKLNRFSLSSVF